MLRTETPVQVLPGQSYRARIGALALLWGFARRLLAYGRRKLDDAVARRRMRRVRQNPAALTAVLRSAKSVLIICHGNIIRSPYAACLMAQALGEARVLAISSAGLEAVTGRPSHPTAILTATRLRVDLSRHTAVRVTPEAVAASDVIFVMDVSQVVLMGRRFPEARAKTFLLAGLAPGTPLEIRDPVDGDASVFQACFDHISQAVRPVVRVLSDTAQRP